MPTKKDSKDPIIRQLDEFEEFMRVYWGLVPLGQIRYPWTTLGPLEFVGDRGILHRSQFWSLLVAIKQRSCAWSFVDGAWRQGKPWTREDAWNFWKTPLRKTWKAAQTEPRKKKKEAEK